MKRKYLLGILLVLTMCFFVIPSKANKTTLQPTDDAGVNSYFDDDNYGASFYMGVGQELFGYDVSYIKFDIPETNKKIISATIKTYWYNFMLQSRMNLCAGTTTNDWNENTITWNNAPYFYYDIIDSQLIGNGEWFNFDVIDYIPESGEFSIIIFEEAISGKYLQGDTKEGILLPEPPHLIIKYEITVMNFIPIIIGVVAVAIIVPVVVAIIVIRHKRKIPRADIKPEKVSEITYCVECGTEILDKSKKFCSKCGSPLK